MDGDRHRFLLLYLQQTGGGFEFRWIRLMQAMDDRGHRRHARTWHSAITGLSNASHTLTVEVVSADSAGIVILGVDCQVSGNGVRIHKPAHQAAAPQAGQRTQVQRVIAAAIAALSSN